MADQAKRVNWPALPPIDYRASIPYESIRYVPGYPERFVKEYAVAYAMLVLQTLDFNTIAEKAWMYDELNK